jgi:hypothetical protein
VTLIKQEEATRPIQVAQEKDRGWIIGVTSLFFILLQSACSAVIAVSGLRLIIGVGSLASASVGLKLLDAFHADSIRLPMMILAIGGSVVNLYVIWRIRSLRARSSSQWRIAAVTPSKKHAEAIQITIAVMTLILVAAEWIMHVRLFGSFFH